MFVRICYNCLEYKTSESESIIYCGTELTVPELCVPQQVLSARARFQFLTPINSSRRHQSERWCLLELVLALGLFGHEWTHRTLYKIVNEWVALDRSPRLSSCAWRMALLNLSSDGSGVMLETPVLLQSTLDDPRTSG